jgi:hypothetical protein
MIRSCGLSSTFRAILFSVAVLTLAINYSE